MNADNPFEMDNIFQENGTTTRMEPLLAMDAEEILVYDDRGNLVGTIEHTPLTCLSNK